MLFLVRPSVLLLKEWELAVKQPEQRKLRQRETSRKSSGAAAHRRNIKSTKSTKARRRRGTRRRRAAQSLQQNWMQEVNIRAGEVLPDIIPSLCYSEK